MSSTAAQIRNRVPRIAEAAVERARLTVVPRRRVRAARVPFVSLVSLLLLGGVVGLLLFNTSMQQASFAATTLEEQAGSLSAREQTLQMEIERLRDPQNVVANALRMGMVPARNPAFINILDGSIEGVPTPATALDGIRIGPKAPVLPASLNPQPQIKIVAPPEGTLTDSGGDTGSASAAGPVPSGRNGSQRHQQSHEHHNR